MYKITGFVSIKNQTITSNDEAYFNSGPGSFPAFAEQWYRHFEVNYSKFHKMDNLSKLGFMGADILLNTKQITTKCGPYGVGVVLSNKSSSLDTDLRHHQQIQNGPASPAVFVYSLPNIVIGEICIRHGIKGENTFFIEPEFQPERQMEYINLLMDSGTLNACVGGWVELLGDQYELFLYLAEADSNEEGLPLTTESLQKLYHLPT